MDFATISKLIQAAGYKQTNTSSNIIQYETFFIKDSSKISVMWQLGGYVKKISAEGIIFESSDEFMKSLM